MGQITFSKTAAVILGVMSANAAHAANWIEVATDRDGTIYYYDAESLRSVNGQIAVWEMLDAKNNRTAKYRSKKIRILYDCVKETRGYMAIITYDADGSVLDSTDYDDYLIDRKNIVPDTIGEVQFKAICKN